MGKEEKVAPVPRLRLGEKSIIDCDSQVFEAAFITEKFPKPTSETRKARPFQR
jgi:hypothetical protein